MNTAAIRKFSIWGAANTVVTMVEIIAAVTGGSVMIFTMVLVSFDALARYFFNAPLSFQYPLTENYLLVAIVTLALSWGYRTGGYIRINAVAGRLPPLGRELLLRAGLLVSAAYVAVLAWTSGVYFLNAWRNGEVQMGLIDWSVAWSWIWVPAGCGLLAMRLVLIALGPERGLHIEHDPTEDAL